MTDRSYKMETGCPPAWPWEQYERYVGERWAALLNSDVQNDERAFQSFLERHPCLLPQYFGGHGPMHDVIFTQPELPGYQSKRPDFMYIAKDSLSITACLFEIEAPSKKWSTTAGQQTAALTQAMRQLRDWRVWFRSPENILQFQSLYKFHLDPSSISREFRQKYILIYGRREEALKYDAFAKVRSTLEGEDQHLMSYDRLSPSQQMSWCFTARLDRSTPDIQFRLLHLNPHSWLNDLARSLSA